MYYINQVPDETGNHGNPVSVRGPGMVALPEELLEDYIAVKGFVVLTLEDQELDEMAPADPVIAGMEVNREALEAYEAEHPEVEPEPEEPDQADVTLDLLADHEYRLCMLELGGEV